jgi:hypothetical protein
LLLHFGFEVNTFSSKYGGYGESDLGDAGLIGFESRNAGRAVRKLVIIVTII